MATEDTDVLRTGDVANNCCLAASAFCSDTMVEVAAVALFNSAVCALLAPVDRDPVNAERGVCCD